MLVTFAPTFDKANSTYERRKKKQRREHAKRVAATLGYATTGSYPANLHSNSKCCFLQSTTPVALVQGMANNKKENPHVAEKKARRENDFHR